MYNRPRPPQPRPLRPTDVLTPAAAGTAAAASLDIIGQDAGNAAVQEWINRLRSKDDAIRGPAWQDAARFGAPAVKPLAEVLRDADFEVARAAKRALWRIVRHAGRPKASAEAAAVVGELTPLLAAGPAHLRREVLQMLSEIGGAEVVGDIAALLSHEELREDARQTLERIPGKASLAALKNALASAPEEFRYALAESLRARGEKSDTYPSGRRTPAKQTTVRPVAADK
jgi:HEAT repeat protein